MEMGPPRQVEAWAGNGPAGIAWYKVQTRVSTVDWAINMWIKNGSGVCGSDTRPDYTRAIACIGISV